MVSPPAPDDGFPDIELTDSDPLDSAAPQFEQILVEHAVRCWDAERENASRLSGRATLLLSALAALFGLGLFRIDWFRGEKDVSRIVNPSMVYVIKGLLCSGLVLFAFAFWRLIGRSGPRAGEGGKDQASDHLSVPESVITDGPPVGDDARKLVFIRVYRAYLDLRERNARKRDALDGGQRFFLFGLGLIGIAIVVYVFASEPPRL